MTQQLNKNTSEVLQWMLDKQDIEVSYNWSDYSYCDYITVLRCLSSIPQYYKFRIKQKEVHGINCYITNTTLLSSSSRLSTYRLSLEMLLDKAQADKLESMLLGTPVVLVTKEFFDEVVANKEMK